MVETNQNSSQSALNIIECSNLLCDCGVVTDHRISRESPLGGVVNLDGQSRLKHKGTNEHVPLICSGSSWRRGNVHGRGWGWVRDRGG